MRSENKNPILISLHSFTPVIGGQFRPWEIGILWKDDRRLSAPLIKKLREQKELNIGDNKPYSGSEPAGYTVDYHVEPLSLPSVAVEFRQDLIEFESGAVRWANIFGDALDHVLATKIS
jgi:predicted N-formylglutamate amidohydrolase